MTVFDRPVGPETYSLIRFGTGYPVRGAPVGAEAILARLKEPDRIADLLPVTPFAAATKAGQGLRDAMRARRKGMSGGDAAVKQWRGWIKNAFNADFLTRLGRAVDTDDPFRERLQAFWSNHFTTRARSGTMRAGGAGYVEEAIRPHLTGRFAELLKAAVTHPFMLVYLDQVGSVGPNSPSGRRHGGGLNENLAREVLELHTLGVGAAYSQTDVTQFAELLTGLHFNLKKGARFLPRLAEPGAETVMGHSYGGGPADLADIHAALDDLAAHPATAAHICGKLAAHFTADVPDPDLVAAMTTAYRDENGDLLTVYRAMLGHRAAWQGFGAKVKQPIELVASGLRALRLSAADLQAPRSGKTAKMLMRALRQMGQPYLSPPGPDGWPDTANVWVTSSGVAARIGWAMAVARHVGPGLPDPRALVAEALGDAASERLTWAAGAAESRAEGVGLILASAEFNRR